MKLVLLSIFLITIGDPAYGNKLKDYSMYFAGVVNHFNTTSDTKEGNMEYLGLSKDFKKGRWTFETGATTYIDSYYLRSYVVFSNISHDRFSYNWFKPMISLTCTYKGKELTSDEKETVCAPFPKLRIGKSRGLHSNITFIPKYKELTNGFLGVEFGYKF